MKLTRAVLAGNDPTAQKKLDALADIDITNVNKTDECIANVMKTDSFAKLLKNKPPKPNLTDCVDFAEGKAEVTGRIIDEVAACAAKANTAAKKKANEQGFKK